jgi:hypothetical protein
MVVWIAKCSNMTVVRLGNKHVLPRRWRWVKRALAADWHVLIALLQGCSLPCFLRCSNRSLAASAEGAAGAPESPRASAAANPQLQAAAVSRMAQQLELGHPQGRHIFLCCDQVARLAACSA